MKVTSYSELRRNLASIIDTAADDHEPVLITRDRGKPAAVLMSLVDFGSYDETAYLLRSPANAEHLRESIKEFEAGRGIERKLSSEARFQRTSLARLFVLAILPIVSNSIGSML